MPRPGRTSSATAPAAESGPKRRARAGLHGGAAASWRSRCDRSRRDGAATTQPSPRSSPLAERPRSTPPVRKLARDLGVDLETVAGTGERGLITRDDVEAAASASPCTRRAARLGRASCRVAHPAHVGPQRRPPRPASRSRACASTPPRRWCAARSPRRTSPSSSRSTSRATMELLAQHPRRSRVRRAQGHPARGRREGAVHRRAPHPRRERPLGRGRAGDRAVRRREPRHRRGDRARARRAEHQGRRAR